MRIRREWWKYLSVFILLYVIIVGLYVPLGPGITSIDDRDLQCGELAMIKIQGYNTHFADANAQGGNRVFLKIDKRNLIEVDSTVVHAQNLLTSFARLPEELPNGMKRSSVSLIVNNAIDGSAFLPNGLVIQQSAAGTGSGVEWQESISGKLEEREGMTFPFRNILVETIRNTYFHVPFWFGMVLLMLVSCIYSVRYLSRKRTDDDLRAVSFVTIAVLFGVLGLATGAIWAKGTWGTYWSWDVKQNMAAISLLIYLAYFILRLSIDDNDKKAKVSAAYSIFAFATLIPLLFVIPRFTDSLHPGNGGNPALGGEDLDNTMRMIFYPAVIGWTLFGVWMAQINFRIQKVRDRLLSENSPSSQ